MGLLDLPQARRFVQGFQGTLLPANTLWEWARSLPKKKRTRTVVEGSSSFDDVRAMMLVDSQLNLVYSVANYRRGVELYSKLGLQWSFVTLYYSAFFAAQACLQAFGGAVRGSIVIEPSVDSSDRLVLSITPSSQGIWRSLGSHERTWQVYFQRVPSIALWIPQMPGRAILTPSPSSTWPIETRNAFNYDPVHAGTLASSIPNGPIAGDPRGSFMGDLSEMHLIARGIVDAGLLIHSVLGVGSSGPNSVGFAGDLDAIVQQHLFEVSPYLPAGAATVARHAPPSGPLSIR